ncbi:hypothetical protein BKK53_07165 [Rodentibacter trehalosifermentans]|nr:hypothetical protein BKK53_07165 [Rodentibacter trehalosifermentans]
MFWDNYYAFNFINNDAKQRFAKSGEFTIDEHNEVITVDLATKNKVHFSGTSVWLYPFNNLDHLLRECLPGLLTLKEMNADFNQLNFIVNEASSDTLEFLKALSIPKESIISINNRWLSFDKLIIPCFGSFGHLHTPSHYYNDIATHIVRSLPSQSPLKEINKRIYVSRRNASVRRILNESSLYEGLTARGFTIIEPGDYAKIRQVELFRDAEIIIGPHGMGIANAIFTENLKLLVEIMQTDWNRVSYFRTAQLKHAHYGAYYVEPLSDSYHSHKTISRDILIDLNKFFLFLDNLLMPH